MRSLLIVLAAVLALTVAHRPSHAVVVDLSKFPSDGAQVPNATVLADQWRPIGILFSARQEGVGPIDPIAEGFGSETERGLFFNPDVFGAVAEFEFVEPGTSNPIDITRFSLVPFFNAGESASLVGLNEFDAVVAQDDVVNAPDGDVPMSISGNFRRVEWRTEGDPGIAASRLMFEVCPLAPRMGCVPAARGSLTIKEKKRGKEKLSAKLVGFAEETLQTDFGDPVTDSTRYDACLYDAADDLVAGLTVARAADTCGAKGKPCWKAKKTIGWAYKDPLAASDGVKQITATSGAVGKGGLKLKAGNNAKKGQGTLPTGLTEALLGSARARLQVTPSDETCFEAVLDNVKRNDALQFKAKAP